jgi:hypothetical protein
LGSAVLALTAAKMIINEPFLDPVFDPPGWQHTAARWALYIGSIVGVLGLGQWAKKKSSSAAAPMPTEQQAG